jgi:peptide/nickel transport system permease protein
MTAFLARRLGQLLLTMVAASMLLFLLTEASPGSVASKILGPYALPSQVEILYQRLGLGDPLPERYLRWAGTLVGLVDNPLSDPAIGLGLEDPRGTRYFGNLGFSLMLKQPVVDAIAQRLGYTALLAAIALAAIVPLSLGIGLVSGVMAGRPVDRGLSMLMIVLTSIPEFVCAVALLLLFTVIWRVLPGTSTMTAGDRWSVPAQLVMPVAVLTIASATYVARIVRASVVDTVRMPSCAPRGSRACPPAGWCCATCCPTR